MKIKKSLLEQLESLNALAGLADVQPELLDQLSESVKESGWEAEVDQWCSQQATTCDLVYQAVAQAAGIDWRASIDDLNVCLDFTRQYPISVARDQSVIAFDGQDNTVLLAAGRCGSLVQQDIVRRLLDRPVKIFLASQSQISSAINAAYQDRDSQTVETIDSLAPSDAFQPRNVTFSDKA